MNDKVTKPNETINQELISQLVLQGDVSKMTDAMKVQYYNQLCHSLNLNPVTRPFQIIAFQGKQILYATKDATEQLRKLNGVSVVELNQEIKDGLCISKCKVQDSSNRFDIATGVTSLTKEETHWENGKAIRTGKIINLSSEEKANAIMKSETKAKRRATLSICGLGMLDESELDTMPVYTTSDISQIKTETKSEPVKTPFIDRAINYFGSLKTKSEVEKAFDDSKGRKEYAELSDDEKASFDEKYLEVIAKFITADDVIPFDIPTEDVKKPVSVSEDLPEIIKLKSCKNVTDLNKAYKDITSVPTYKQYGWEYKEEIDSVFESVKEQIKERNKK